MCSAGGQELDQPAVELAASPSLALQEANRRLGELRARYAQTRPSPPPALPTPPISPTPPQEISWHDIPAHLGWGSAALTAVLRAQQSAAITSPPTPAPPPPPPPTPPVVATIKPDPATVSLYPEMAFSWLRQGLAPVGRIWLLLRHLDVTGQGWLTLSEARAQLTTPHTAGRVCSWRRLRMLLSQGEGIFWQRDAQRVWLRRVGRVAQALAIPRLTQVPVALAVSVLRQSIGEVKAHFYASFHSSRKHSSPISRETLHRLSGVPDRTQRVYDKKAGVRRQRNLAVGSPLTAVQLQQCAWEKGAATFVFVDHAGRQGTAGTRYVAWQLPNSYYGHHARLGKGKLRRINRRLQDLVDPGERGNSQRPMRRFHPNGAQAGQHCNRYPQETHYWPGATYPGGRLWYRLAAMGIG